jgi:hypothetical protein
LPVSPACLAEAGRRRRVVARDGGRSFEGLAYPPGPTRQSRPARWPCRKRREGRGSKPRPVTVGQNAREIGVVSRMAPT